MTWFTNRFEFDGEPGDGRSVMKNTPDGRRVCAGTMCTPELARAVANALNTVVFSPERMERMLTEEDT